MYKKKVCDMDFDVVEYGDVLYASIKEQRNQAAQFVYDRYMDIYNAVMHVVGLGLVALLEEDHTLEYLRLKRVFEMIDKRVKSVTLHLSNVKDGDEIRPEHVNELYEPFPKLSRYIMFAIMMARAATLYYIDDIITNLDELIECIRTYFDIKVRHLDLIQSYHWNRILDMVDACCVAPILSEEDAEKQKTELRKRMLTFNRIMDEVLDEVLKAIDRCVEQNECEEMNRSIHEWIMKTILSNAITFRNYFNDVDYEQLIAKYVIPTKTAAAFAMYMYKYNKYPENLFERYQEAVKMQTNRLMIENITSSVGHANEVIVDLLMNGKYKGNEAFASLSIYCLGQIYFGAILGANERYSYEEISSDEAYNILASYNLEGYIDPFSAYKIYAINTIPDEHLLDVKIISALVFVYVGTNYTRVSVIAFGQYISGNIAFCFVPPSGVRICINTILNRHGPTYFDVYVDRLGNIQVVGPTESEIIIAP